MAKNVFRNYKRQIAFLCFMSLLATACSQKEDTWYLHLDFNEYQQYSVKDSLLATPHIIVTKGINPSMSWQMPMLIKKNTKDKTEYYKISADSYLENDSTIVVYASPFKSGNEKNGLWLYADFFDGENKQGNAIYSTTDSGVRFAIDSVPYTTYSIKLPTREGIYIFKENKLILANKEQSEDVFYTLNKDGFYFIPNTGRLFKRHNINTIN